MWTIRSEWTPYDGQDVGPVETHVLTKKEAESGGLHLSCCSGVTRITVLSPEGEIAYSYDRKDHIWFEHDQLHKYMQEHLGLTLEQAKECVRMCLSDDPEDVFTLADALPHVMGNLLAKE